MSRLTYKEAAEAVAQNGGNVTKTAKELGIPRLTLRTILQAGQGQLTDLEEHKLKVEVQHLKKKLTSALNKAAEDLDLLSVANTAGAAVLDPPAWLTPREPDNTAAVACTMLSDSHFDEVVDPAQVQYINGYNREVAVARLQAYFENLIHLAYHHISGLELQGLVVAMAGDMVSGNIHEELKETNETDVIETAIFWSEQLAAGFELVLEHFDDIYVPCVVGNHGRLTRKPRAKGRPRASFDWLIYKLLEKHFKDVHEINFDVSDAPDANFVVFNTRYLLTHGDQFRGGTGISGALAPLMLGLHRKTRRQISVQNPFDVMLIGHWHQLIFLDNLVVNGSLKGTDEYAFQSNFGVEPARQAFWVTTPNIFKTMQSPILCKNEAEYWEK